MRHENPAREAAARRRAAAVFRVRVSCSKALPCLAWVARVDLKEAGISVECGPLVEAQPGFLVEGAWDGTFSAGRLHETEAVFGTGAVFEPDRVVFVTSAATTDPLYYAVRGEMVSVSNSLPLLLAAIGESLDPALRAYDGVSESVIRGLDDYVDRIPTRSGEVRQLFFENLEVSVSGLAVRPKPSPPEFADYRGYVAYLRSRMEALFGNARAPARGTPMAIRSTQSKGYDSTAINAIAASLGVPAAYTITKANVRGAFASDEDPRLQPDDDGSEICERLGMAAIRVQRREFTEGIPDELLYYCAVPKTTDANMVGIFRDLDAPTLLLTGQFGEVWRATNPPSVINDRLIRWDAAGQGLSELRLQLGLVQLPVPFIGGQGRRHIARISTSEEMAAFRARDAGYDKPIARRIAVEAGVPEQLFGQRKMASTVSVVFPTLPLDRGLREEYLRFLVDNRVLTRTVLGCLPAVHAYNARVLKITPEGRRFLYYVERALKRVRGERAELQPLLEWLNGSLFCFAVNRRTREYARILHAGAHR